MLNIKNRQEEKKENVNPLGSFDGTDFSFGHICKYFLETV